MAKDLMCFAGNYENIGAIAMEHFRWRLERGFTVSIAYCGFTWREKETLGKQDRDSRQSARWKRMKFQLNVLMYEMVKRIRLLQVLAFIYHTFNVRHSLLRCVDTRIWHAPPRRRSGHTKRRKFLSTGLADILIDAGLFVCASYLDQLQFHVALAKLAPSL